MQGQHGVKTYIVVNTASQWVVAHADDFEGANTKRKQLGPDHKVAKMVSYKGYRYRDGNPVIADWYVR